jgi:hypothetical protein
LTASGASVWPSQGRLVRCGETRTYSFVRGLTRIQVVRSKAAEELCTLTPAVDMTSRVELRHQSVFTSNRNNKQHSRSFSIRKNPHLLSMATPEERFELITRRLQEVLGGDTIKAILDKGESPVAYWGTYSAKYLCVKHLLIIMHSLGTAPTGRREMHLSTTEHIILNSLGSTHRVFCPSHEDRGFFAGRR